MMHHTVGIKLLVGRTTFRLAATFEMEKLSMRLYMVDFMTQCCKTRNADTCRTCGETYIAFFFRRGSARFVPARFVPARFSSFVRYRL